MTAQPQPDPSSPMPPPRTPVQLLAEIHSMYTASIHVPDFRSWLEINLFPPYGSSVRIREFHSMIVAAIKRDDTELITDLLRYGLPISHLYLEEAIKSKAKDTLEAFFINGWNINQPTGDLSPPLLAYAVKDEEMTTWLLNHGADPNGQCKIDDTPLSYAVHAAPLSNIKLMFDCGGDIHRGQLLHRAIYRENDVIEVVTMLLEKGAPLNAIMYQDHEFSRVILDYLGPGTALHRAAELGRVDVVHHLLSWGADTTILDTKGRTALERAESRNQTEVVEMLKAVAQDLSK